MLRSFEDVLEAGRDFGAAQPGLLSRRELAKGGPTTSAMIAYTSGTTGSAQGRDAAAIAT